MKKLMIVLFAFFQIIVLSNEKLINPIFSQDAGFYNKPFYLKLESNAKDAIIYYTLDGTDPDPNSTSTYIYNKPIYISKNTNPLNIEFIKTSPDWVPPQKDVYKGVVVKAKAIWNNIESDIVVKSYFIGKKYSFPVISLVLDPKLLFDEETGIFVPGIHYEEGDRWSGNYYYLDKELMAHFEFFENGEIKYSDYIGFEISGNFSRSLPLKSIKLTAKGKYGKKKIEYPIFDQKNIIGDTIKEYDSIVLRNGGNAYNGIIIRDVIGQEISKGMDFEKQAYRPAVLFIDGVYWGIVNIREKQDEEYIESHYLTDDVTIIEISSEFKNGYGLYRGKEEEYNNFLDLKKFIMNNDMTKEENFDVVKRNIDLNSYLDYMVAEMFIDNRDWPGNNMKIWKKHKDNLDIVGHDGKWRFMMYDTDNGLYEYDSNMFLHAIEGNPEVWHPNPIWSTEMFKKLLTNKEFRYRFINTYMDHLNNTFDVNNTHKIIERLEHEYEKELIEHFNRWHNNTIEKWESGIEYVEYFLTQRPSYVKKQLEEYFNVDIVKMFLKFRGDGEIYINDRFIYNNNRNIEYVKNIPIKLKAVSNENSKFLYWVVDNNKIYENEINIVPKENLIITPVFENKDNKNLLFIISSLLIGGAIIYILNK